MSTPTNTPKDKAHRARKQKSNAQTKPAQVITIEQLFKATPSTPTAATPRGRNNATPPVTQRRQTQRSPTNGNFATPAYADSPKASELPPPPPQWLMPKSVTTKTPRRQQVAQASSSPKFTGMDFIRQMALVAQ